MTLWIRIDANIGENPNVWRLADSAGVSAESCVGLLVILFGKVAEHEPHGDLSAVPDALLERWAGWRGGQGIFAAAFRSLFLTDGVIDGWEKRQGALIERAEKEKERWHRRKLRGGSAEESAARNVTVRNRTTPLPPAGDAVRSDPPPRKRQSGALPPYSPLFEQAMTLYPHRPGNSKRDAWVQWRKRLDEGKTEAAMLEGTRLFAAWVASQQWDDRRKIKMASTFFGPGWHFEATYGDPDAADTLLVGGWMSPELERATRPAA